MATFSPPTDPFVVWASDDEVGIFAYLRPGERGRNIFKLVDGTFTENQPQYVTDATKVYYGGHIYELSAVEEQELIDAGYGDYITP